MGERIGARADSAGHHFPGAVGRSADGRRGGGKRHGAHCQRVAIRHQLLARGGLVLRRLPEGPAPAVRHLHEPALGTAVVQPQVPDSNLRVLGRLQIYRRQVQRHSCRNQQLRAASDDQRHRDLRSRPVSDSDDTPSRL